MNEQPARILTWKPDGSWDDVGEMAARWMGFREPTGELADLLKPGMVFTFRWDGGTLLMEQVPPEA